MGEKQRKNGIVIKIILTILSILLILQTVIGLILYIDPSELCVDGVVVMSHTLYLLTLILLLIFLWKEKLKLLIILGLINIVLAIYTSLSGLTGFGIDYTVSILMQPDKLIMIFAPIIMIIFTATISKNK